MAWTSTARCPAPTRTPGETETSLLRFLAPWTVRVDLLAPGATTPVQELMPRLRAEGVRAVSAQRRARRPDRGQRRGGASPARADRHPRRTRDRRPRGRSRRSPRRRRAARRHWLRPMPSPLHSVPGPLPRPVERRLPDDFGARLSDRTRVCDDGRTLVGGTAGSVLFLAPEATGVVAALPGRVGDGPLVGRVVRLLLDRGFADPWWPDQAAADADVDDVTVVVPVQDRPATLDLLLGSLPSVVPVVVVDDGSADPDAVAEVADRHGARLVVHRRNLGPAAARNTGLRRVDTAFAAFCDSDVRARAGLARHAAPAPRRPGARGGRAADPRLCPSRRRRLAGALRAGPLLARPRRPPRGGPRARSGVVPPQRLPAGPRRRAR